KSGSVSWNGGDHPLSDDFRMQSKIDRQIGVSARYELVVADRGQLQNLKSNTPNDISFVDVRYVPNGDMDLLFANYPQLNGWLDTISARPPRKSTREQTFQRLFAAWAMSRGTVTLHEVVNSAATGADALIGPIGESYELTEALKVTLDS